MFVAHYSAKSEVDADDCRVVSCAWGGGQAACAFNNMKSTIDQRKAQLQGFTEIYNG